MMTTSSSSVDLGSLPQPVSIPDGSIVVAGEDGRIQFLSRRGKFLRADRVSKTNGVTFLAYFPKFQAPTDSLWLGIRFSLVEYSVPNAEIVPHPSMRSQWEEPICSACVVGFRGEQRIVSASPNDKAMVIHSPPGTPSTNCRNQLAKWGWECLRERSRWWGYAAVAAFDYDNFLYSTSTSDGRLLQWDPMRDCTQSWPSVTSIGLSPGSQSYCYQIGLLEDVHAVVTGTNQGTRGIGEVQIVDVRRVHMFIVQSRIKIHASVSCLATFMDTYVAVGAEGDGETGSFQVYDLRKIVDSADCVWKEAALPTPRSTCVEKNCARLVWCDEMGWVRCRDIRTGDRMWDFQTKGEEEGTPPPSLHSICYYTQHHRWRDEIDVESSEILLEERILYIISLENFRSLIIKGVGFSFYLPSSLCRRPVQGRNFISVQCQQQQ